MNTIQENKGEGIVEKLAADIRFHCRQITSENMIPVIESALQEVAAEAREKAIEECYQLLKKESSLNESLALERAIGLVLALAAPSKTEEGK